MVMSSLVLGIGAMLWEGRGKRLRSGFGALYFVPCSSSLLAPLTCRLTSDHSMMENGADRVIK